MTGSLIEELKRRNVFRVAIIYVVVSWLLMQIGDVMFPALRLPDWTTTLLVAFLLLGFPLVIVFAWAFELTPDGVVRTTDVPPEQSITSATGQKINFVIIGALVVAVTFLLAKDWLEPPAPIASAAVADQSIAVLPFKNNSASTENAEFFADGLHDELLTLLSRLDELRVISRTSVEHLQTGLTIPEIGALLGVATILEGQVQRAGDRLRINVQLIDTANEGHLWANTYDSELTAENIFDVQSDIARTIANALHAELSPDAEKLLDKAPTMNTAALENYLLGVQISKRNTFGAIEEAINYLRQATRLDPGFAQAWAALAKVYSQALRTGAITRDEYIREVEPVIRTALALDARLPTAHAQQALLQMALNDMTGAEQSFRQALELDPDDPGTVVEYAFYLRDEFRFEDAIELLDEAIAGDPLNTELLFQLGKAYLHAGKPQRTLEYAARLREIDPSIISGYSLAGQSYIWSGDNAKAANWALKGIERDPSDYEQWATFSLTLESLGEPALADRYLQRAAEIGPGEPAVLMCRTLLLVARGEHDAATRIARKALQDRLDDRWGSDLVFLRTVRDAALATDNVSDVLELYRERAPRLFAAEPVVTGDTLEHAADLVLLMRHAGEEEQASRIIAAALDLYDRINPQRARGYGSKIIDVELLALDGQVELAMERLREAVDSGWLFAPMYFVQGRNLEALQDQPGYPALVARLEARLLEQGAEWRATPVTSDFDLRDAPSK